MKTISTFVTLFIVIINAQAQNYMITFAANGASNSVDSVKVENLSQCIRLTLGGTDTLNLTTTVGIDEQNNHADGFVHIYPNPASGNSNIEFDAVSDENIMISIIDFSGKVVTQHSIFVKEGYHIFRFNGIDAGTYLIRINSSKLNYTTKFISYGAEVNVPEIKYHGRKSIPESPREKPSSSMSGKFCNGKSTIRMLYNYGDTLKFTGKSGNFRTVSMLFPTQSQTVTFTFVNCTDADNNHYTVVQIGTQLWMQENLKTTHYRDGTAIPNVTDSLTWGSLTTGAYCNFHNDIAEGDYYGRLYNFYAVSDARNIAPAGWHVASNSEWNVMGKFLDPTVDTSATAWMGRGTVIGRILKEGCDTRWQYYDTTYGWNSAGFTALCSNFRNNTGAWSLAPDNNHDDAFWTSTSYSVNTAWGLSLRWCYSDIYVMPLMNMRSGQSVRCIKD